MKSETIEVFRCDHCRKIYQRKALAIQHEKLCKKNPINQRICFGCPMLTKKETFVYYDHPNGSESKRRVELLYCEYKETFLYTPQNHIKQNFFELGDEENNPMPTECDVDLVAEFLKTNLF